MADEKISQLPAVTTVGTGDLEVVVATNVTSKITMQQFINALVSFITAIVNIGGGKITLNPTGAASFGNGTSTIDASGNATATSLSLASGKFVVNNAGVPTEISDVPTAGIGQPIIVATTSIGPTRSVGPINLFNTGVAGAVCRINGYLQIIMADGTPGTIQISLNYTDVNGAQTVDLSGTQDINAVGSFPCTGQAPGTNVFFAAPVTNVAFTVTVAGGSASASTQLDLVLEVLTQQ